jgi:hypothetical protein
MPWGPFNNRVGFFEILKAVFFTMWPLKTFEFETPDLKQYFGRGDASHIEQYFFNGGGNLQFSKTVIRLGVPV